MKDVKADAVFITSPWNIQYLSGFSGGEGYLFITKKTTTLVTDFRYMIWAKRQCEGVDIIDMERDYFHPLKELINKEKVNTIAIEAEHMSVAAFNQLKHELMQIDFISLNNQIDDLRMVKSEREIERIQKAEEIGDLAFAEVVKKIRPGMTELEVAARIEYELKLHGGEALSFETIAASGENSAMPHATPTNRNLTDGDFLTMDFGCKYEGYCSDMTRTVCIGKATDKMRHVYETVLQANELAISKIRPGMTGKEVDKIARDYIAEQGYDGCFGHGLGHSVGLQIHERPSFSLREDGVIKENMVITVEPGIYLEGCFGVRIEDVVCITKDGVRNLTSSPKQLFEL